MSNPPAGHYDIDGNQSDNGDDVYNGHGHGYDDDDDFGVNVHLQMLWHQFHIASFPWCCLALSHCKHPENWG